jgi:hypothetical protein
MPRPDWSRPLPRKLTIPDVMTLRTLGDVRTLIGHVPKQRREFHTWRHVVAVLDEAAAHKRDSADVSIAVQMALDLEHVPVRLARPERTERQFKEPPPIRRS